jgi:hypothetical protein
MIQCQCPQPGICPRHPQLNAGVKSGTLWRLCQTRPDYFCHWERQAGRECDASLAAGGNPPAAIALAKPIAGHASALRKNPCKHLGAETYLEHCPTCPGHVEIKVFKCNVHGQCSLAKQLSKLACCASCPDYLESSNQ